MVLESWRWQQCVGDRQWHNHNMWSQRNTTSSIIYHISYITYMDTVLICGDIHTLRHVGQYYSHGNNPIYFYRLLGIRQRLAESCHTGNSISTQIQSNSTGVNVGCCEITCEWWDKSTKVRSECDHNRERERVTGQRRLHHSTVYCIYKYVGLYMLRIYIYMYMLQECVCVCVWWGVPAGQCHQLTTVTLSHVSLSPNIPTPVTTILYHSTRRCHNYRYSSRCPHSNIGDRVISVRVRVSLSLHKY